MTHTLYTIKKNSTIAATLDSSIFNILLKQKNKKAILQQVLWQDFQDIRQDAKFYSFYDLNVFK